MSAPEIMRSFIAALLLGPGLVVAADSETGTRRTNRQPQLKWRLP